MGIEIIYFKVEHWNWHKWLLWCQKQVSQAGISNCIPQDTVEYNYLSLPEIPVSGTKGLKYYGTQEQLNPTTASSCQNQSWYIMLWASGRSCNGVQMCFPKTPYNFACWRLYMMTSSNGDICRVTGPLCEEFTSHRWIPLTNASDVELWCFLWSVSEQTAE